jgi:ribosomal protein S18 acetylase RimI-like enzyme
MLRFRAFDKSDAEKVARIHAHSWQSAYKGILRPEYLAGPVFEERLSVWRERLSGRDNKHVALLAEEETTPLGFAFAVQDEDPRWGSHLDNLHVVTAQRGRGIGTRLLTALVEELIARGSESGLYLWVYEENTRARRFYERVGAEVIKREEIDAPGGGTVLHWLYAWRSLSGLRALISKSLHSKSF